MHFHQANVIRNDYIPIIHVICRRQNGKRQIPRQQICRQQIPRRQTANENHHILAIKGGFSRIKTPPLHKKFSMQDSCSKSRPRSQCVNIMLTSCPMKF